MSNIHGFNDLEAQAPVYRRESGNYVSSVRSSEEPRCIDLFLPDWRWTSFTVWISAVQIIVYVVTLAMGSSGLEPYSSVLSRFGSAYGPSIQQGQVWRLVTPLLLHGSISHIVLNVFFQLRLGLPLEVRYGNATIAGIYMACGLAGNLVSVAMAPCKTSVGASTAGFGLIGVQMAELALMWHLLADRRPYAIANILTFVLMSLAMSMSSSMHIDWRGHLGGFIAGFCFGIWLGRDLEHRPLWLKTVGYPVAAICLSAVYIATTVVIFAIPMTGARGRCI